MDNKPTIFEIEEANVVSLYNALVLLPYKDSFPIIEFLKKALVKKEESVPVKESLKPVPRAEEAV